MTGDGEIVYMECQSLPHASCRTFMVADKLVQPLLDEGKKVCITIKPEEIFRLRGPVKPAINAPLIAILLAREGENYSIDEPYVQAVLMTGANIKFIHYQNPAEQAAGADGLLLPGGFFPTPGEWYANPDEDDGTPPSPRTLAYMELIKFAEEKKLPMLGICGGMQMMAGMRGAKLSRVIQPMVKTSVEHRAICANEYAHEVALAENSLLREMAGTANIRVNSRHSEAVTTVPGDRLRVTATAPDGIAEAIEFRNYDGYALGVQWHPERMAVQQEKFSMQIYQSLTDAAGAYKKHKAQN